MTRKIYLEAIGLIAAITCSLTIVIISCRKNNDAAVVITNDSPVSIAEARILYGHIKSNLAGRMTGLGYKDLSPDYKNSRAASLSPKHHALYLPLFFNKETGKYIHLLIMKENNRFRSLVILLEPDKQWYANGKALNLYRYMDGCISYYGSSGVFRQSMRIEKGLIVAGPEIGPNMKKENSNILLPGYPVGLANDAAQKGIKEEVLAKSSSCEMSCHGDLGAGPCTGNWGEFGCIELPPVIIISTPPATPPVIPPFLPFNPSPGLGPLPSPWTGYPPFPGGEVSLPEEPELEVAKTVSWTVASNPDPGQNGIGEIKSFERIKGRRVANSQHGGYFTSISHYQSTCNFCSSSNQNNVWVEDLSSSGITDPWQCFMAIYGTLYFNQRVNKISNTKRWQYNEVF